MPLHAFEMRRGILLFEDLAVDPFEPHLDLVGDAAVRQRFAQRLVGVEQAGVFPDDRDDHFAFWISDALGDQPPTRQIRFSRGGQAESCQHLTVEPFRMIGDAARRKCWRHRSA